MPLWLTALLVYLALVLPAGLAVLAFLRVGAACDRVADCSPAVPAARLPERLAS